MRFTFLFLISFTLISFNNVSAEEDWIAVLKQQSITGKKCLASIDKGNMDYENLQYSLKNAVSNFNAVQDSNDKVYELSVGWLRKFHSGINAQDKLYNLPACNKAISNRRW